MIFVVRSAHIGDSTSVAHVLAVHVLEFASYICATYVSVAAFGDMHVVVVVAVVVRDMLVRVVIAVLVVSVDVVVVVENDVEYDCSDILCSHLPAFDHFSASHADSIVAVGMGCSMEEGGHASRGCVWPCGGGDFAMGVFSFSFLRFLLDVEMGEVVGLIGLALLLGCVV